MKHFFYLVIFSAFTTAAQAQTGPVAKNIKASITENNLLLTWNEASASQQGSWEVQASANGKDFSTIGLVWGADPKGSADSYAFKQKAGKIQPQYKYFRVLYVEGADALASNTIRVSK
jgi:hypothetical protein